MKARDHRITLHMTWLQFTCCPLLLLLMLNLPGCASTQGPEKTVAPQTNEPAVARVEEAFTESWKQGMEAFQGENYNAAASLFEVLSENTTHEASRQRALFALAATRLILADNPEEYTQAMRVWELWSRKHPPASEGEDPTMLTPFLERLVPPGARRTSTPAESPPKPHKHVERSNIYNSYMVCKDLLRTREKELERVKASIGAKDREIRKLKKQITSLEEIHLKFQEKKQEITSP